MKHYHVIMDDEHRIDVKATSAADAMQRALELHLKHRVSHCWLGNASSCWTEYEIPKHEPLKELAVKPKRGVKVPDEGELRVGTVEENRRQKEKPAHWIAEFLSQKDEDLF